MRIFLAGAVSSTDKKQLNKYQTYRNVLIDCFENVELITPDDIWNFREKCIANNPNRNKLEIDKVMVDYDLDCVRNSDLIVCDLSALSTGMGLELGVAHERNKEVVFCYEETSYISNMVTGAYPNATFIAYSNLNDLSIKLRENLNINGKDNLKK